MTEFAGCRTVADSLARWITRSPQSVAVRSLRAGHQSLELSFGELDHKIGMLANLLARRTSPGDRVLLLFKTGPEFITAFLACQRTGLVAVPVRLPGMRESQTRISSIIGDCTPSLVLTQLSARQSLASYLFGRPVIEVDVQQPEDSQKRADERYTELALLQYTSGTTGTPKGVMITHQNLLTNTHICLERSRATRGSSVVSWLPHYHDMGLVGAILVPLCSGHEQTLMSPADFLRRPLSWLEAVSHYRADVIIAPNFAYELCAQKLMAEAHLARFEDIDLSRLRVAFVGAEIVHAATLERFAAAAGPFGFSPQAFLSCYGLAESTLFVDGIQGSVPQISRPFAAGDLAVGRVPPKSGGGVLQTDRVLVASGKRSSAQAGDVIVISPDAGQELPDGMIGIIALSNPSISPGYWGREAENAANFRNTVSGRQGRHYFRTGDLGFFHDDLLFVIGRSDDLVIMNGVNCYPEDIEELTASADPALPKWRAAAFATGQGTDLKMVVMQEGPRRGDPARDEVRLVRSIQKALFDNLALGGVEVLIIMPGRLPVTSTGKIRRTECRAIYEAGEIDSMLWRGRRGADGVAIAPKPAESSPEAMRNRWRDVVGVIVGRPGAEIDLERPISDYALDSLKLVELQASLEAQFGIALDPEDFLDAPDLGSLIKDDLPKRRTTAGDILEDAQSAEGMRPSLRRTATDDFLVTGATGMLGTRVVQELLRQTSGKIYCLVRGRDERLLSSLRNVGVTTSLFGDRLIAVSSHLSRGHFGLDGDCYRALAATIGTVVHCAADIDFVKPYRDLRAVNVEAVRAILEFAATGAAKRVFHVSSISVLETPEKRGRSLCEWEALANPATLANGYAQSKWAAEAMMMGARKRGFEITICRAPWLLDPLDVTHGRADGFIRSVIAGCVQMGHAPDSATTLNLMPVDFVGKAIAVLASRHATRETVYHLGAGRMLAVWELAGLIRTPASDVALEPFEAWCDRVEFRLARDENFALKRYAPLFRRRDSGGSIVTAYLRGDMPSMNSLNTHEILKAMGLTEIPSADTMCGLIRSVAAAVREGQAATVVS
jgi:thioester reductase-like protein